VKEQGKPSAFFLHGFLGQPHDWDRVLQCLPISDSWNVCCFNIWDDLPLLEFISIKDWLDAFADEFGSMSPMVLCGYSLGARLAMALACRHPGLIEGLVVVSGHPGLLSESEQKARILDDRRWGEIFRNEPWPEAIKLWNQRDVFAGHQIQPSPDAFSPVKLQHCLDIFGLGRQPDLRPCLKQLKIPVLWVVGKTDSKFARLAHESWLDDSSITVREIIGCGHRVLHEKPQELAALLRTFLTMNTSLEGNV
jgi:2-succinyl-6-hydroxy-2,4-cyclohexadiene-1-carboxylate synthase